MKQGKGIFYPPTRFNARCAECGEYIGPGTKEQPAYWAYERVSVYGDRTYYHRSCARKVSKRRVAERERNMAELRAMQKAQAH